MIGQTLGPYKIIEQIGAGGMATVYKAYQPAMERYVAIKVLPPNMAQDPAFSTRFLQETRTIARLEHPFILPVHDSGNERGIAYLVMRYLEGGSLTDVLAKGRPLLRYSLRLIQRIAEALEYAHAQGIVHRDIKPSNILVDKNDQPYLTDFGIAKILENSLNLTGSALIGTPAYMSPEQGQGQPVDQRSDIYSLGVVLYELVTGRRPFDADTPMAVLFKHIQEPLPPPSTVVPDLPPHVEAVILKALEKKREDRYATAGDFARALEDAITATGQPARAATPPGPPRSTVAARPRPETPASSGAQPGTVPPTPTGAKPKRTLRAGTLPPPPAPKDQESKRRRPNGLALLGCAGLGMIILILALTAMWFVPGLLTQAGSAGTQTFVAAYNQAVASLTFEAALTQAWATANAATPQPLGLTVTSSPASLTDTPALTPSATLSAAPCADNAKFVADVTVPDNSSFSPSTPFTKTWRIQNTGTCTWDTAYTLRFLGGAQMNGPGSLPFPGTISPGATMDISIDLTSPATPGSYGGRWRLANKEGNLFGTNGNPLTVVIVVPGTPTPTVTPTWTPTATPTATSFIVLIPPGGFKFPKTVTLNPSSSGGIYAPPRTVFGAPNPGDDESDRTRQGFVTFDLSSIPAEATLSAVRLDLSSYDRLGNPFSLGCLRAYQQNYGTLDGSDFFSGPASGALVRFCSAAQLSDESAQAMESSGISAVQSSLASGRFQIRLQFNEQATNTNGTADLLRPVPKLIVTYTTP